MAKAKTQAASNPRDIAIEISGVEGIDLRNLDQYFGPWAIDEERFSALVKSLDRFDLSSHVESNDPARSKARAEPRPRMASGEWSYDPKTGMFVSEDGIALVEITGSMTKRGSSFSGPGTVAIRNQVRSAARNASIRGIMLAIESPGGTLAGTKELADEVARAAESKPVHAYIEDIGASAAYYVASQANHVSANEPAFVGSIGTFMVVYDASRAYENAGIKVHVIRAGANKGAGTPGTQITEGQLASWQSLIDDSNAMFLDAVARGRKMTAAQVKSLATGDVFLARDAKANGLLDAIGSFESALSQLDMAAGKTRKTEKKKMTTEASEPVTATVAQLRQACPGASSDFLLSQFEKDATLEAAQREFIAQQQASIEKLTAENVKLADAVATFSKQVEQMESIKIGNKAIQSTGTVKYENASEAWRLKVKDKIDAGMDRTAASSAVNQENPGLREQMLEELSQSRKSA